MTQSVASHRTKKRITRLMAALAVVVGLSTGACGDGDEDTAGSLEASVSSRSLPSLKVYVLENGEAKLREFQPAGIESTRASLESNSTAQVDPGSLRVPGNELQFTPNLTSDFDALPTESETWDLVRFAARECQRGGAYDSFFSVPDTPYWDTWYVYSQFPFSCEGQLVMQENLVCVADKLAEVADAVGTIEWKKAGVVIPQQSSRDKVVAQELALNALAHFGRLVELSPLGWSVFPETSPGPDFRPGRSCAEHLYYLNENPDLLSSADVDAFGVNTGESTPTFTEGETLNKANLDRFVRLRLDLSAHLIRAAGRLLRELVIGIVESDLGQAEQARSSAPDAAEGAGRAWGVTNDGYGTLRHALRVLYGRLEFANNGPYSSDYESWFAPSGRDPTCQGYKSFLTSAPSARGSTEADLFTALPAGFSVRWEEHEPASAEQRTARDLFATTGVVPASWPPTNKDEWVAKARLVLPDQMSRDVALTNGVGPGAFEGSVFDDGEVGEAHRRAVEALSDGDLLFGARAALWRYQAMAAVDSDTVMTEDEDRLRGLVRKAAAEVSPHASDEFVVYQTALWDQDMRTASSAYLGAARGARHCSRNNPSNPLDFDRYTGAFDDVSSLASVLRGNLRVMRDVLGIDVAKFASTELEDLAGNDFDVVVNNGGYSNWGPGIRVDDDDTAGLGVIAAHPWEIDCAIGRRQSCPADAQYLPFIRGGDSNVWEPPTGIEFIGDPVELEGRIIYLVREGTSSEPGQVLDVLPSGHGFYTARSSPLRRRLTEQLMSLQLEPERFASCKNERPRTSPSTYCLLGVDRDAFVPLANELSAAGEGDATWQHYLDLADDAATRADDLANEIIGTGLSQDIRRETAGRRLRDLCGPTTSLSDVDFLGDGSNSNIEDLECTAAKTRGVVFLGEVPANPDAVIAEAGCSSDDCQSGDHVGLGLVEPVPEGQRPLGKYCDFLEQLPPQPGPQRMAELASLVDPLVRKIAISGLTLSIDRDTNWSVASGDRLILNAPVDLPSSAPAAPEPFFEYPVCKDVTWCEGHSVEGTCCSPLARDLDRALGTEGADVDRLALFERIAGGLLLRLDDLRSTGSFSMPIPAVRLGADQSAPPIAVYGHGEYFPTAEAGVFALLDRSSAFSSHGLQRFGGEGAALGDAVSAIGSEEYLALLERMGAPLPELYSLLRAEPSRALLVNAVSGPAERAGEDGHVQTKHFHPTPFLPPESTIVSSTRRLATELCPRGFGFKLTQVPLNGFYPRVNRVFDPQADYRSSESERGPGSDSCAGTTIARSCIIDTEDEHGCVSFYGSVLSPLWSGPAERIYAFLPSVPGPDDVGAQMANAALACAATQGSLDGELIDIDGIEDIDVVAQWVKVERQRLQESLQRLFVPGIPQEAIDLVLEGKLPFADASGGEIAGVSSEIAVALSEIAVLTQNAMYRLELMESRLRQAKSELRLLEEQGRMAELELELQKQQNRARAIAGVVSVIGATLATAATGGAAAPALAASVMGATQGGLSAVETGRQLDQTAASLGTVQGIQGDAVGQGVADDIEGLVVQSSGDMQAVKGRLVLITDRLRALSALRAELEVEVAIASGSDFAMVDGHPIAMPVNTVYRRQYDYLTQRYRDALRQAKTYSYLARLSIEQRLGIRLDSLKEPVGAMAAPSEWVDRVCTMSGVDYETLRDADSGFDAAEFADEFVGDYVQQLREFMELYRVEFPFQNAHDRTVISLRDHVLEDEAICSQTSANLLFHSSDLFAFGSYEIGEHQVLKSVEGWLPVGCSQDGCLEATSNQTPGSTLLTFVPDDLANLAVDRRAMVYQSVSVEPGQYVLTVEVRGQETPGSLKAVVLNADGDVVGFQDIPFQKDQGQFTRVEVEITEGGTHHVGFEMASAASVVVTNVGFQLAATLPQGLAPDFTNTTREVFTPECLKGNPELFRQAFVEGEDEAGRYYQLRKPFRLTDPRGAPSGTFTSAGGNYNYRHSALAVNLVGTGIRDCTGAGQSCYATGIVEYDLEHTAFNAPIEDYFGSRTCFSFGRGLISQGKALASERYISVPLSSDDESLLEQPGLAQRVFSGRPLAGSYRLKIYDSDALNWSALEDVQLILTSGHWSRVERDQAD